MNKRLYIATYGDNDINIHVGSQLLGDLVSEGFSHSQTALVNRDAINDRIGTRKVNVLENARREAGLGNKLAAGNGQVLVDNHSLTRLEILEISKAATITDNTLGSKHVVGSLGRLALGESNGANTMGITETNDTESCWMNYDKC